MAFTHPILTCAHAAEFEAGLLRGEESAEWVAMSRAGAAIGRAVLNDFHETGFLPETPRVLLLLGKGHNAGDACIAAQEMLKVCPSARIDAVCVGAPSEMRPLAKRAFDALATAAVDALRVMDYRGNPSPRYDICLDGLIGMGFKPPVRQAEADIIGWANALPDVTLRAAVDLPSGIGDTGDTANAYRADFSYMPGIAKAPAFASANISSVGRRRYLDIGFFEESTLADATSEVVLPEILAPLRALRNPLGDKRDYGHLFVVGGSRGMPGAVAMAVEAAVRAGVGLVTAFVPSAGMTALAAKVPEAMWMPCPVNDKGGLGMASFDTLAPHLNKATAILIGPGMGTDAETLRFVKRVINHAQLPVVVDADALQSEVLYGLRKRSERCGPAILTPHIGEFNRIAGREGDAVDDTELLQYAGRSGSVTVLKGTLTRISDGARMAHSPFGGPILARGGSGDILAGITGALYARPGADAFEVAMRAVAWHGLAADAMARECGQQAVRTTQLMDYLATSLRYGK